MGTVAAKQSVDSSDNEEQRMMDAYLLRTSTDWVYDKAGILLRKRELEFFQWRESLDVFIQFISGVFFEFLSL